MRSVASGSEEASRTARQVRSAHGTPALCSDRAGPMPGHHLARREWSGERTAGVPVGVGPGAGPCVEAGVGGVRRSLAVRVGCRGWVRAAVMMSGWSTGVACVVARPRESQRCRRGGRQRGGGAGSWPVGVGGRRISRKRKRRSFVHLEKTFWQQN